MSSIGLKEANGYFWKRIAFCRSMPVKIDAFIFEHSSYHALLNSIVNLKLNTDLCHSYIYFYCCNQTTFNLISSVPYNPNGLMHN